MREIIRLLCSRWLAAAAFLTPAAMLAATENAAERLEPYVWRNVAINGGGFVTGLLFHPNEPGLLYARTDVGGAFRFDPAARHWIALNDNLGPDDAELLGVVSFAVDASDPGRLYLACGSYLPDWGRPAAFLASADRGASWSRVALPFHLGGNSDGRQAGERLQVDPHDAAVLLLGTNQEGLWRSGDRGQTWRRVESLGLKALTAVLFDPGSGRAGSPTPVVYAASEDISKPTLYRSADSGESWTVVPGQPAGLMIQHADIDRHGVLYLSYANNRGPNDTTDGAVWKYDPGNGRWTDVTPVVPNVSQHDGFGYAGLALDAGHEGTLLVSTLDRWAHGDEIFRSTDGGKNWKPMLARSTWDHGAARYTLPFKPHWIGALAIDPRDSARAWFVTGYGLWSTTQAAAVEHDNATPWTFADEGLEETVVSELVSPPAGAPLLSAILDVGGFRHEDLATAPARGALQDSRGSSTSIAVAAQVPAKLVRTHAGDARGAISVDSGLTWSDFATTPAPAKTNGAGKIAISCDGRRLVWLPKGSGPYYSANDGATWIQAAAHFESPTDFRTSGVVADSVNPDKFLVYDVASGQVQRSDDGGANFSVAATLPPGGGGARCEPGRAGSVWVPTPQGLFVSRDSGRNFVPVAAVKEARQVGFGRAAPGSESPAIYVAGKVQDRFGIFRSTDGGATWLLLNGPSLQFGWIGAITGDPRIFGRVYVGTGGRGIFYGEPAGR